MAEPKKETVRIALPPRPNQTSSLPAEKRDTARIVLPSRTPVVPPRRLPPTITPLPSADSTAESPTILQRPPVTPPQSTVSPLLQPLPKPPGPDAESQPAITPLPGARDETSAQADSASIHRGPKQETARISILPRPIAAPAPAINMTKTQPLLIRPASSGVQPVPFVISSKPFDPIAAIPKSYCWGLFGVAALIFLIQIWNFFVS